MGGQSQTVQPPSYYTVVHQQLSKNPHVSTKSTVNKCPSPHPSIKGNHRTAIIKQHAGDQDDKNDSDDRSPRRFTDGQDKLLNITSDYLKQLTPVNSPTPVSKHSPHHAISVLSSILARYESAGLLERSKFISEDDENIWTRQTNSERTSPRARPACCRRTCGCEESTDRSPSNSKHIRARSLPHCSNPTALTDVQRAFVKMTADNHVRRRVLLCRCSVKCTLWCSEDGELVPKEQCCCPLRNTNNHDVLETTC